MVDWWTELESDILTYVKRMGLVTPAEVGLDLGLSEATAASLLAILVREGKIRMCLVQSVDDEASAPEPDATGWRFDVT